MTKEKIWTKPFLSLFITNIAVFMVFYGLVTALPLYAVGVLGKTDEDAGLLMSMFLLSAIVVRPFTGKVLDVVGKRKMLWFSLFFYVICTILYGIVTSFPLLLMLRFLQGIWFSIITTATVAIVADIVPPTRRGAGLGYFNMSNNLAVVLGPLIALPIVQTLSFDALFIILSILIIIGSLFAITAPKDSVDDVMEKSLSIKMSDLFEKSAIPAAIIGFFVSISYASVLSYLSLYAKEKDVLAYASPFFIVFAFVMLITRPYTGKLYDEKGSHYVVIPGFLSFIIGLALLGYMSGPVTFLVAGGLIGFGYGAIVPSLQTIAVQSTSPKRSGYATATFFTFFDSGVALGSYILGVIAVMYSYKTVYVAAASIAFIVLLGYSLFKKRQKTA